MKADDRKIIFEFIKVGFILIVIGAVIGALYEVNWKIETKIILGGFFIMLAIVANEVSRIFHLTDLLSAVHSKTLLQLILMGKKQGVKEKVADVWDEILVAEKKKLDFERQLTGNIDAKVYVGFIIIIAVIAVVTVNIIKDF